MIAKEFMRLLFSGAIDVETAPIVVSLVSQQLSLTDAATTASNFIGIPNLIVTDTAIPTGKIPAKLIVTDAGVKFVTQPAVVKMYQARTVGGVLVYIEGTYGGTSNPIVAYTDIELDKYYNVAMLNSGEHLIKTVKGY